jgi:hypothetical protein
VVLEIQAQLVLQVLLELMEQLVLQVLLEPQVTLDLQDQLVLLVLQELLARLGQLVLKVSQLILLEACQTLLTCHSVLTTMMPILSKQTATSTFGMEIPGMMLGRLLGRRGQQDQLVRQAL